jgi:hypothetical protein
MTACTDLAEFCLNRFKFAIDFRPMCRDRVPGGNPAANRTTTEAHDALLDAA